MIISSAKDKPGAAAGDGALAGTFLEDPLDAPAAVVDFVAAQLEVANPSQVKRYTRRTKTRFDHQWEIRQVYGLQEFPDVEKEFAGWVAARSWTSGDGPKAIFLAGVAWLRKRKVLLPGVSTLARLVARIRDEQTRRLWAVLEGLLSTGHEPEPGGVVLGGHQAPAGPARRPGRGGAGGHRAAARLDAQEVVLAHPRIVS